MPVNHHSAPATAHKTLQTTLPELLQTEAVHALLQSDAGDLAYSHTLPVYSVGENTLADGRLLDDIVLIGWRYLLFDSETAVASIDLNAEATEVVKMTQGRFVQLALEGLEVAQQLEETTHTDYFVNYIEIYGLYFAALWLHSETVDDIIIPLEDHDDGDVSAMVAYSEAEILALLQQKTSFPALNPERE